MFRYAKRNMNKPINLLVVVDGALSKIWKTPSSHIRKIYNKFQATRNLKFYLENSTTTSNTKSTTWATAITGMDTLYDGTYAIPVSATATTSSFVLSDTFTYTGSGIQVAYDYLGATFDTTLATYDCNNTVPSDLKMIATTTTTPGAVLTSSSSWRPGLYITYRNPFTNDMAVEFLVLDKGHHNKIYDTTQTIVGTVTNNSIGALTAVPVTLEITGANPSTSTQTVATLAAGASQNVTFSGLSAANGGIQSIKLSVPTDQFTTNDSIVLSQSINCDTLSYADNSAPYTSIGFNTGSGILAAKHTGSSTINSSVKSVYFELSNDTRNVGNQLQALVLDSGGVIIDSSAAITVTTAQIGTKISMNLTGNNVITTANPDFYIGIRQYANATTGYFPISSKNPSMPLTDRFFGFGFSGGAASAPFTTLGTLAIGATVFPEEITLTSSDANDSICTGESVTFTASGTSSLTYDFQSGGTSVQNSAATTYTVSPAATAAISVEGEYNTCPILSNSVNLIVVTVDSSASKTNDSTGAAAMTMAGTSYQWIDCGTGLAVPGATSQVFTASATGNYKVAVSLGGCSDTSSCYFFILPTASISNNGIKSLSIYPSPANNYLVVKTENVAITSLTVVDVNGKLISTNTPQNSSVKLDVSQLKSGVYLLKIETANGSEVKRFIKQ